MQTNLLKPKAIQVEQLGHNKSKVTLEPFERGYGHTLGNALRRVLLSSMVGYAVTDVTIAGVLHEYSSIDGVQEDVVNILLNLKGVVFKLHNRDEVTLSLRKDGEGQVTAADIQTPHDVEIINPEHVIANLSHGGKIDIQLKVEKGRGYVPGSMRRHADEVSKSIGRIVLDASFSPVKRVSYSVENARVEQRTDLDRLVVRARKMSRQPKQKLNAAFKNAAASAKATATVKTPPAPVTDAITATSAKPSPTAWANCGGRTSSKVTDDFKRGLIKDLKISAYGVNCGPRSAPMAKTIA